MVAAAMPQGDAKTLDCAAADQVAELVIDFFQPIQIEEQNRKVASGAFGALNFRFHDFEQFAMVGQAGQRIGSGQGG